VGFVFENITGDTWNRWYAMGIYIPVAHYQVRHE
jgi:hypothetical protein